MNGLMVAWADHEWKTDVLSRSLLVNVLRSFAISSSSFPKDGNARDVDCSFDLAMNVWLRPLLEGLVGAVPRGHFGLEGLDGQWTEDERVCVEGLQRESITEARLRLFARLASHIRSPTL
jgi:hypothetical protein